jgi:spore germination protein GerM
MSMRLALLCLVAAVFTAGCTGDGGEPASSAEPSQSAASERSPVPSVAAGKPTASGARTLKVFLSTEKNCGDVRPVERELPNTEAVATAALRELFSGRLTEQEQAAGLTGFGPDTADLLGGLRIADGIAYVNLNASHRNAIDSAGTSCGGSAFQSMVGNTLRQFPTVEEVRYAFDRDPKAWIEFTQGACPEEPIPPGDPCDPRPWVPGQRG